MRKALLLSISAVFLVVFSLYAQIKKDEATGELEITGIIIDNKSAEKYHDELERFIRMYPKAQAILPVSVESGYSIYVDSELYKFNEESNKKIVEFLQKRNNILKVVIKAEEIDDELELKSIKNEYIGIRGARNE